LKSQNSKVEQKFFKNLAFSPEIKRKPRRFGLTLCLLAEVGFDTSAKFSDHQRTQWNDCFRTLARNPTHVGVTWTD
jgi:hypothetical protein